MALASFACGVLSSDQSLALEREVVPAGLARLTDEGIYNSVLVIERGRVLGIYFINPETVDDHRR